MHVNLLLYFRAFYVISVLLSQQAKVLKKLELPDVTYETAIAFTLQVLSRVQRPGYAPLLR